MSIFLNKFMLLEHLNTEAYFKCFKNLRLILFILFLKRKNMYYNNERFQLNYSKLQIDEILL